MHVGRVGEPPAREALGGEAELGERWRWRRFARRLYGDSMNAKEVLVETYGRVPPLVREAVEGLTPDQLLHRPTADANPIAWLVWHMGRLHDMQMSELLERDQLWVTDGWAARFGLEPDPSNMGYGHTSADVAAVQPESPDVLLDYFAAAQRLTDEVLASVQEDELERIIDRSFDPPVTLGVRLVSIADDCLQHCGQAAYVRGLLGA